MAYEKKTYEESDSVKKARESLAAQQGLKPGAYQSQWQTQLNDTMNKILNREKFAYDLNGDALWNQYKDRYVNLGQQAMMDTMGQAAKLTGGYGNSYAQTAGQQAYQGYLQGLTDKIPELYQLALDRYNREGDDMMQRYGLLSNQDDRDFNRYLSNYDIWSGERDYLTGRLDADRTFDYGAFRDDAADSQWQAEFDEAVRQFNFANKLGEFAPTGGGGGTRGGGTGGSTKNFIYEAGDIAREYGTNEAIKWINSQSDATKNEKIQATANAQGVAATDHYKKLLNSGYYKK